MNIFNTLLIQPLANGLIVFYQLLGSNLGLAVIAFTLLLRFVLHPLTKPYMESMKKMKDYAPQLEKIKKKYKGDPVKLAQAQSDFYKTKGISPGAGCLPYLLQIVILIAFFNMFNKVLAVDMDPVQAFNNLLYEPLKFSPGETLNTSFLYLDLRQPDIISLSQLPFSIPGPTIILAALSQFVSAKIMQPYTNAEEKVAEKTKEKADDMQVMIQQSMIYTFPVFTLFIGMRFASALAIYWLVFSVFQVYQQYSSQGWGGLTPWIKRLNLIKSDGSRK